MLNCIFLRSMNPVYSGRTRIRNWILLGSTILLFMTDAFGIRRESIHFETVMSYEELPNLSIRAIYQDQYGLIWIGTEAGLVCYNGHSYRTFRNSSTDPTSISSKIITAIGEGPDGTLWVNTYDGLNRFNRKEENFRHYKLRNNAGNSLTPGGSCMEFDSKGRVLIGTVAGLPIFDPSTETWDLTYATAHRSKLFTKDIQPLGDDNYLIATITGFKYLDLNSGQITLLPNSPRHQDNSVIEGRSILKDSKNRTWMGTIAAGLFVFDEEGTPLIYEFSHRTNHPSSLGTIRFVHEDHEGNIWIGSLNRGLTILPNGSNEYWRFENDLRDPQTIPSSELTEIVQTKDNQLLVGTNASGVFSFDHNKQDFDYYTRTSPFKDTLVTIPLSHIATGPDGQIWLNDTTRKLTRFDPVTRKMTSWIGGESIIKDVTNSIFSLAIDQNNRLFVMNINGILYSVEIESGLFDTPTINTEGLVEKRIDQRGKLHIDSLNYLWILGDHLFRYDIERNIIKKIGDSSQMQNAQFKPSAVYENEQNDLWFGSFNRGFYYYSRSQDDITEIYNTGFNAELLKESRVTGLYQQHDDYLWMTTESGVGRFNLKTKSFDNPAYIEPIATIPFYGLQCDGTGHLWLSMATGLIRLDDVNQSLSKYGKEDGLLAVDFIDGPFARPSKDLMIIGGKTGLNLFSPQSIGIRSPPPKVIITDIEVRSEEDPNYPFSIEDAPYLAETLTLPCSNNSFSISFASITPGNSSALEYAYKLDGLENQWTYTSDRNQATYTNVPAGNYTFRVKSKYTGHDWKEDSTAIGVHIHAPYYYKPWFFALMAILVLFALYLVIRFRTYRIKLINQKLAKQVYHRTRDLEDSRNEAVEARQLAEQADKAKTTFLATVTHEIKTPMNGVLGMSELLEKTELDPIQKNYVEAINQSGSTLMNIINDILDYSKIEAGKFEIQPSECDIHKTIGDVTNLFRYEAEKRSLKISTNIDTDVALTILADQNRLKQVLTNLVSNAIKFTNRGSVTITVSNTPPQGHHRLSKIPPHKDSAPPLRNFKSRLYFSVTDTGIGIAPTDLDKLFRSFSQLDNARDKKFGGTGIGLVISKRLVNLMGGDIAVRSSPNEGSTFVFTILTQAIEGQLPTGPKAEPIVRGSNNLTVLIVDDNFINRTVAEGLVQHLGHKAQSVESGQQAIQTLLTIPYQVVLMDMQMPDLDGFETSKLIRTRIPPHQQPLIFAMSASTPEEIENKIKAYGLDGIIPKPITEESLSELFKKSFERISSL
jgi:signal transduction histidine kinase/ligand-binding sensor domain-containing protein/CheY-like chemotaxis protein